jgi:hypothetical protein
MTTPKRNEAVAYGVRSLKDAGAPHYGLWMTTFGLANIDRKEAEGFVAWANEHRAEDGPFEVVDLHPVSTIAALQGEVSRLREALNRCRPAVVAWQAMAGVGEIAESVRVPFRAAPEEYAERQREAAELLTVIDGDPIFHLRSYGDVTASELHKLTNLEPPTDGR